MSDPNPISIYPSSTAQRQQIVSQARKHDASISEYCLMAIEQRIARETEAERLDDLNIETRLDDLKTDIIADIETATDVNTLQEFYYGAALWKLIGSEFSGEERYQAMSKAPDKMKSELENLAEKDGDDH